MQITEVVKLVKRDKLPSSFRDIGWLHARILKLAQMMYHLRLFFKDEFVDYDQWRMEVDALHQMNLLKLSPVLQLYLEVPQPDDGVRDICRQLDPKFNEIDVVINLLRRSGKEQGRSVSTKYPRAELLKKHSIQYDIWKEDLERTLRSMARMK
jgi:hypothetical protein